MKKNLISAAALVLALASLVLSAASMLRQPEQSSELTQSPEQAALITALQDENAALQAQVEALAARVDALEDGSGSVFCNLTVDAWEEQNGTLVLTAALLQAQIPQNSAIDTAQLVLAHNGQEIARADVMLESGTVPGSYQLALSDTWFPLPNLGDDDVLDIYPEILLTNGDLLTAESISWYYTAGGLFTAVG